MPGSLKSAAVLSPRVLQALACGAAAAQSEQSCRGRLRYDIHGIACHVEQLHWRVARLAADRSPPA